MGRDERGIQPHKREAPQILESGLRFGPGRPTAHVSKVDVALRLGMDVSNREGFDEFMAIVQYFDDLGCICTFQSGGAQGYREYGDLRITDQGVDKVEQSAP